MGRGLHHHRRMASARPSAKSGSTQVTSAAASAGTAWTSPVASSPIAVLQCLVGLPESISTFFKSMEATSDHDVAGAFMSEAEIAELGAGKGWTDGEIMAATCAWKEATHRASRARSTLEIATAPTPTVATSTCSSVASLTSINVPPPTGPAPSTAKQTASAQTFGHTGDFLEDALTEATVNTVVVQEVKRKDHAMLQLKSLWLEMGFLGLHWQHGPPHIQELRWGFLLRAGQRLTGSTVTKHVKAWTAWRQWATEVMKITDIQVLVAPQAMLLAQFLDMETTRGATLGRSRTQSYRWLRERLGLPFPVTDVVLDDFKHFPLDHVSHAAVTLTPATFLNIVAALNEHGPVKCQEQLVVLFVACACLRHKHLSISRITGHGEDFIHGWCPKGKSRRRGTRPPFAWTVPRPTFIKGTFEFVITAAERMQFPDFVIPARAKTRCMPTRRWLPRPMGHMMLMRVLRQVAKAAGLPQADTERLTFNTLRRFLPTIANVTQMPKHECQAIGNWVEDETLNKDVATSSARPMSVHYSDQKALSSGLAKQKAIHNFTQLLSYVPAAKHILEGGSKPIAHE